MSCNLITIQGGRKMARPIDNRLEYLSLRASATQVANLRVIRDMAAQQTDDEEEQQHNLQIIDRAKRQLLQFNYSGYYPQGTVKGNKLPSRAFGFDIDDRAEFERIVPLLIADDGGPTPLAQELELLMLERSARQGGHAVFARQQGKTILENQVRIAQRLDCEMDTSAHDINRVYFTTTADAADLLYLNDQLFADAYDEKWAADEAHALEDREKYGLEKVPEGAHKADKHYRPQKPTELSEPSPCPSRGGRGVSTDAGTGAVSSESGAVDAKNCIAENCGTAQHLTPLPPREGMGEGSYLGIPYQTIIDKWWEMYNQGQCPIRSNRDVLTFELAVNLRHICGFDRDLLDQVIPCYDGFSHDQKMKCIDSALSERRTSMPKRLRDVLDLLMGKSLTSEEDLPDGESDNWEALQQADENYSYDKLPPLPMGVSDSVDAAGHPLAMAILIGIAPAIGTLATGVKLDVHKRMRGLNLCSFIVGEYASGKGQVDDVIASWMNELQAEADVYTDQEDEWARKVNQMKSGKAPEQPQYPVRMLTFNNTVANIAERLKHTGGKHSFSFTPEADTVAQKWKQSMCDFSVMLRQAYDEARYDREAKSAGAARVHIPHLRWNVTMCGTQDAMYRVISNSIDGLLSRMSIARTPDNTFAPLDDDPPILTDEQDQRIRQVAHLLPLMEGSLVLPELEKRSHWWLEKIRTDASLDHDGVFARMRMRCCVNAMRITVALWLPFVAQRLIEKHGYYNAEEMLKQNPQLCETIMLEEQNDDMLKLFDLMADYLIENDLYYFHSRIMKATQQLQAEGNPVFLHSRNRKNNSIYARLPLVFSFEQALQQVLAARGFTSKNQVHQMIKNWMKQQLIKRVGKAMYEKIYLFN